MLINLFYNLKNELQTLQDLNLNRDKLDFKIERIEETPLGENLITVIVYDHSRAYRMVFICDKDYNILDYEIVEEVNLSNSMFLFP